MGAALHGVTVLGPDIVRGVEGSLHRRNPPVAFDAPPDINRTGASATVTSPVLLIPAAAAATALPTSPATPTTTRPRQPPGSTTNPPTTTAPAAASGPVATATTTIAPAATPSPAPLLTLPTVCLPMVQTCTPSHEL